ncbi:MAG: hypothetical protein FRX48_06742 [Lasallia pustulata]|uniref:G-patch domain-containing protein n=1 Tax=Lasallia pustulata TaxID=136370 RepID=A0A5M8PIG3_9LECA|nr:MAG: hypothetical protein FRX48_06742 [Lasallia pustulata]
MATEDEYFVPLEDQRVFGAGIKRKRVTFVPADSAPLPAVQSTPDTSAVGHRYLSIVLGKTQSQVQIDPNDHPSQQNAPTPLSRDTSAVKALCSICNLPLPPQPQPTSHPHPHEASIAHQVCLTHSHPPSHLDRSRHGLKYLSSYGWDPDSRLGLGAMGSGIRDPVKGKIKNDTAGLGVEKAKTGKRVGEGKGEVGCQEVAEEGGGGEEEEGEVKGVVLSE